MDFQALHLLFKYGKDYGREKIRESGLGDTSCRIAAYILMHESCTQEETARALGLDKTTAAKSLRLLEEKGLILRERDALDKRKKTLRMTKNGRIRVMSVMDLHDKWLREVLGCLSPEEQKQLSDYFDRILCTAESMLKNKRSEERQNETGK